MNSGSLTVAAIDIGTIADTPRRTIFRLCNDDIIICESLHELKHICLQHDIDLSNKKMFEFNAHISSPEKTIDELISCCKNGKNITLISNAGTPLIKDPGYEIVKRFREENLQVSVVPGPSAVVAALSISGIQVEDFYFFGWIPSRYKDRIEVLNHIKNNFKTTVVMFESLFTNAYHSMLDIVNVFGNDITICILIDITRGDMEESFYGKTSDALPWLDKIINSENLSTTNPMMRYITYVIDNNFKQEE